MIKNILFDFGDVFINLDKAASASAMARFGFKGMNAEIENLFLTYEKGLISSDTFIKSAKNHFPSASKKQLIDAWNAILLDFPLERLTFLEELAATKKYRMFLLSNTNALHIDYVRYKMGDTLFGRFTNSFEKVFMSYEIHLRKPDLEIYDHVLSTKSLLPKETLFIDDTLENIDAAKVLGIKTWHLQVGQEDILVLNNKLSNA